MHTRVRAIITEDLLRALAISVACELKSKRTETTYHWYLLRQNLEQQGPNTFGVSFQLATEYELYRLTT